MTLLDDHGEDGSAQVRTLTAAVVLMATTLALLVLTGSVAGASTVTVLSHPHGSSAPVALASTGLDITIPVVIGLTTLVVGIALVAWGFLRSPRRRHH